MSIKQQIEQDLKAAMLAGDKSLVTVLRGLKSTILYAEVAKGSRETGLSDEEIIELFAKEAKKRQESADLYTQGGSAERASAELAEKSVIEKYLPSQLTDDELTALVDAAVQTVEGDPKSVMGKVIAMVKAQSAGRADGARIAQIVKNKLG
jgi:uncharacterized protein YqeY